MPCAPAQVEQSEQHSAGLQHPGAGCILNDAGKHGSVTPRLRLCEWPDEVRKTVAVVQQVRCHICAEMRQVAGDPATAHIGPAAEEPHHGEGRERDEDGVRWHPTAGRDPQHIARRFVHYIRKDRGEERRGTIGTSACRRQLAGGKVAW